MICVAIAEDHAPTRERMALFLERSGRAQVVLTAPDGEALLRGVAALPHDRRPDVAVVDVEMPGPDGIETTARLRAAFPATQVLIFTVFEDDERLFAAIAAGAGGYLLKDQPLPDVLDALEELHAGGAPVSPPLARRLLEHLRRPVPPSAERFSLTDREVEVLNAVVEGLTNVEIAARLFVSPTTVKTHVRHIYEKLHVSSRAGATQAALRHGLVR
jgi:DNA-binding NarL/FixJ family response regulator